MPFAIDAEGADTTLQLVGRLRIEDAASLFAALRAHCTSSTNLRVQAEECLSAEYSILQLLCSAGKTVAHMRIINSSPELSAVLALCGLTDEASKPQLATREELEPA